MRGERYAAGCNPQLVEFITRELPYMSWEDAEAAYPAIMRGATPAEIAFLGCNDRYFLLTSLLHRADVNREWVYDRCREVEFEPDGFLDLWARYHYKSTIITFAGSIQEILCDPEVTIGIFAVTNEVAKPFLAQIKEELESNDGLKRLYSDVLWQKPRAEAPRWSAIDGIVVRRKGNPKECTVEAYGLIDAMPTSKHFKILNYDDLVTEKSVTNEEQTVKVVMKWELSRNLGTTEGSPSRYAGTRYSFGDAYGVLLDRGVIKPRIYPATDNGRLNGVPVLMSQLAWDRAKMEQRSTVAAQMLLNPLAGKTNIFRLQWLRPYELRPRILNVYIMADPSKGPASKSRSSDRTAMAVIGIDVNRNRYLLDGYCHRMTLSERWAHLKGLYIKWSETPGVQLCHVGYESYGMQTDLEYFEERMLVDRIAFEIEELAWTRAGGQSKPDRIERLEPYFKDSQFYVPPKCWHSEMATTVTWHIEVEDILLADDDEEQPAKIVYEKWTGHTRLQRRVIEEGQKYRVPEPIRRRDEDGKAYDLFRRFVEEFVFFPFAPHDDFLDAVSRIEDMEPAAPVVYEKDAFVPAAYPDA